jgi:hypothetical protein
MRKARPAPKGKGCRKTDYAHEERKACKLRELVEDIMPTRNTVADAPLDRMVLAFVGLRPRTRLQFKLLSQSLGLTEVPSFESMAGCYTATLTR